AGAADETLRQELAHGRVLGEAKRQFHQSPLGFGHVGGGLYQIQNAVDVRHRQDKPFQQVGSLARPAEQVRRPPSDDLFAVVEELLEQVQQRQCARGAIDQRDVDYAERRLQRRVLVELVNKYGKIY
ncbi:MAG: hypothetical protein R6U35_01800, partial [Candidatus Humimicrobiaceae bacterium]